MGFVKGMITGIMVGAAINAINNEGLPNILRRSKKEMRRFKRRMSI